MIKYLIQIGVGASVFQVKLLNEMIKTKDMIAKEDFQRGLINKKSLQTILLKNKLHLLQLAFQQSKLTQK